MSAIPVQNLRLVPTVEPLWNLGPQSSPSEPNRSFEVTLRRESDSASGAVEPRNTDSAPSANRPNPIESSSESHGDSSRTTNRPARSTDPSAPHDGPSAEHESASVNDEDTSYAEEASDDPTADEATLLVADVAKNQLPEVVESVEAEAGEASDGDELGRAAERLLQKVTTRARDAESDSATPLDDAAAEIAATESAAIDPLSEAEGQRGESGKTKTTSHSKSGTKGARESVHRAPDIEAPDQTRQATNAAMQSSGDRDSAPAITEPSGKPARDSRVERVASNEIPVEFQGDSSYSPTSSTEAIQTALSDLGSRDAARDESSPAHRPLSVSADVLAPRGADATAIPQDTTIGSRTPSRGLVGQINDARGEGHAATSGVDQARFVERVARAMQVAESRGGPLRLRLHPPELGAIKIEVHVRAGVMQARIEAETGTAKTLLMDQLPILRERLAEQGVRVEQFDVNVMDRRAGGDPTGFEGQRQPLERGPDRSAERAKEAADRADSRGREPKRNSGPNAGNLDVVV